MPKAFVTGITGQDGQHLAEFLHGQGYDVLGMVKGQNNPRAQQLADEFPYVELVSGRPDRSQALARGFLGSPNSDEAWWAVKNGTLDHAGLKWLRQRVRK